MAFGGRAGAKVFGGKKGFGSAGTKPTQPSGFSKGKSFADKQPSKSAGEMPPKKTPYSDELSHHIDSKAAYSNQIAYKTKYKPYDNQAPNAASKAGITSSGRKGSKVF